MEFPGLLITSLVASAIGVGSHLGYFIHGEHHKNSPKILTCFLIAPTVLFISLWKIGAGLSISAATSITAVGSTSYFTALAISILTYRAFFHPLRNFPGPFSYRLSKLVQVFSIAKDSNNYIQAEELHKKYGDIVRVGPNELTILSAEALQKMVGVGSKCTKAPWYDGAALPYATLHTTRDRNSHDKRRKAWDQAFSAKALRHYESRVTKYADELTSQLKIFSGKPLNASIWLNFYSFDVMGDLAFGKSFDMLRSGEQHFALKLLQDGMAPIGIFSPIPWVFPILFNIPGAATEMKTFIEWSASQAAARKEKEPEAPDIMTWLLEAEKNSADPINSDVRWRQGDARLIIVAGSDTTASTLTHTMYHLARDPQIVSRLREELKPIYDAGVETELRDVQNAKYLNGIINESLRLHPPVPSGVLRQTPPEGITVGSAFIPGEVTVSSPSYSMGRLESCYQHAEEFLPERWAEKPELVLNKSAFAPFSAGVYSCIGKQLALMELRTVVARIVTQFDINFAPGEDGTNLLTKTRDCFTLDLAPLMIVFTERA